MPRLKPQRPTEAQSGRQHDEITRTHPAFGLIGAGRATGGNITLFGSPLKHNSTVKICIQEAVENLHLHREWHHPTRIVAEVILSEAQWATFISTMNVGSGVPCTLRYKPIGGIEEVPGIKDTSFAQKQAADIERTVARKIAEMTDIVADFKRLAEVGSIPKGKARDIAERLQILVGQMPGHAGFMAESLTKHAEDAVVAAKAEVDAFVTRRALQFPTLVNEAPEVVGIEDQRKEEE